ncbi:hypothetical protein NYP20_16230 [Pseudomonas sp. N3-W]|uniref:hypothetical protein n=1 Tax=Pseudomonas sp. N3-W TaxID=2975049 RepID=UPI00217E9F17|nr:hypothetical protein [Pseudomonas sp. N3-W]UWF46897.1 hypothetical protein NYP20_16230 [Pseudomonas sp. N3-W]
MSDHTELKRLLDACRAENCNGPREFSKAVGELFDVCTIETIADLVAENERLTGSVVHRRAQADQYDKALTEIADQRDQLKASFKNFHRSLCARFGYFHDDIDWQRDQMSLEEHIATQFGHVSAEAGALRSQMEVVQRGAGQLKAENEALLDAMTRIMHSARLGDPVFAIACEVVGELSAAATDKGEQS